MDVLIKLYDLPDWPPVSPLPGLTLRKPIGPEHHLLIDWIATHFTSGWASEAQVALANRPVTLFVATQSNAPVGFACYDATARGMFGPIGVHTSARGAGVGRALLLACLHDMRSAGYAYAVAGWVESVAFFQRVAGATEITGSSPGLYEGMLRT